MQSERQSGSDGDGRFDFADLVGDRPGQKVGDPIDWMIGDALDDETQIGFGVEAVEFGRADQAVDGSGAFAAGIRPGKQIVLAADGQFALILPISGKKLKSIIDGIRCMVVASRFVTLSNAAAVT